MYSICKHIYIYYIYIHATAILPTDACCPDIYIEDVILSNMIRGIAENTAYTQCFLV